MNYESFLNQQYQITQECDKHTKSAGWKVELISFILVSSFRSRKEFYYIFDEVKGFFTTTNKKETISGLYSFTKCYGIGMKKFCFLINLSGLLGVCHAN